jgi:hypothetical protein
MVDSDYALPPDLDERTVTVSAVDFDNPATSVPVTLNSATNGGTTKHLKVTFPPMDRRVKLVVTTDDGITGQSGPIQVNTDSNTDGDAINDIVETALQRTPGQRDAPPLTISRLGFSLRAVLASRPVDLKGWVVVIEQSTDLKAWVPAPAAATTVSPNPDGTTERVTVLLPANGVTYFVRLKASKP